MPRTSPASCVDVELRGPHARPSFPSPYLLADAWFTAHLWSTCSSPTRSSCWAPTLPAVRACRAEPRGAQSTTPGDRGLPPEVMENPRRTRERDAGEPNGGAYIRPQPRREEQLGEPPTPLSLTLIHLLSGEGSARGQQSVLRRAAAGKLGDSCKATGAPPGSCSGSCTERQVEPLGTSFATARTHGSRQLVRCLR